MNIKVNFDNIKVKETKKDFTVKILMLKGERGKSAYEVAVDNGYNGTEEEWNTLLAMNNNEKLYEVEVEFNYMLSDENYYE